MNRIAIVVTLVAALALTACVPITREAAAPPAPASDAEAILQQIMEADPQAPDYAESMVAMFAPDGDMTLVFGPGNENYLRGADVLMPHFQAMATENFRMTPGDVTVEGNAVTSRGTTEWTGAPPFPTEFVLEVENSLVKHAIWRVVLPEGAEAAAAPAAPAAVPDRTPREVVEEFARLSQPMSAETLDEVMALFAPDASITRNAPSGGQQVIRGNGAIRSWRETLTNIGGYSAFDLLGEEGDTVTTHTTFWVDAANATAEDPPQTPPFSESTVVFTVRDGQIQDFTQTVD